MRVTIVSTLPFPLTEDKPGLIPSHFYVPAAKHNGIALAIIDDGYHLTFPPFQEQPNKIIDTGEVIAQSVIDDYTGANLAVVLDARPDGAVAKPGLFWFPDVMAEPIIKATKAAEIEQAFKNTAAWFYELVKMADDDWKKNQQFKSITNLQRQACNYLQLRKEWNYEVSDLLNNLCWACKSQVHPDALICARCSTVLKPELLEQRKKELANA